jgi:hypothetical protein
MVCAVSRNELDMEAEKIKEDAIFISGGKGTGDGSARYARSRWVRWRQCNLAHKGSVRMPCTEYSGSAGPSYFSSLCPHRTNNIIWGSFAGLFSSLGRRRHGTATQIKVPADRFATNVHPVNGRCAKEPDNTVIF